MSYSTGSKIFWEDPKKRYVGMELGLLHADRTCWARARSEKTKKGSDSINTEEFIIGLFQPIAQMHVSHALLNT